MEIRIDCELIKLEQKKFKEFKNNINTGRASGTRPGALPLKKEI